MQTFMTHMSFGRTARALDDRRLGKQRLEAMQTLDQITMGQGGYPNHPINRAWTGYEYGLAVYGMFMCLEWTSRGFADNMIFKFHDAVEEMRKEMEAGERLLFENPPWLDDKDILRSHRSNLVRKQREGTVTGRDYARDFRGTPANMPYLWPFVDGTEYEIRISKADIKRLKDGERQLPDDIAERVANL